MVPVHQDDHHLLAVQWQDKVYVDTAQPFGLRSAPLVFTAMADLGIVHRRSPMAIALPG